MSTEKLQAAYEQAVKTHGKELADEASLYSVEAWYSSVLSGCDHDKCEAEQLAAFELALERLAP